MGVGNVAPTGCSMERSVLKRLDYRVDSDGVLTTVELGSSDRSTALESLTHTLATYSQQGVALAVAWRCPELIASELAEILVRWAELADTRRGLALSVPDRWLGSVRAVCSDLAHQGVLIGAYSELTGAQRFALREGQIWWADEGRWLEPATTRIAQGCSRSARRQSDDALRA